MQRPKETYEAWLSPHLEPQAFESLAPGLIAPFGFSTYENRPQVVNRFRYIDISFLEPTLRLIRRARYADLRTKDFPCCARSFRHLWAFANHPGAVRRRTGRRWSLGRFSWFEKLSSSGSAGSANITATGSGSNTTTTYSLYTGRRWFHARTRHGYLGRVSGFDAFFRDRQCRLRRFRWKRLWPNRDFIIGGAGLFPAAEISPSRRSNQLPTDAVPRHSGIPAAHGLI